MARRLTRGLRTWLLVDCVLVLIAGVQLYVFAERTDRLFAWTITPPLTAAFLGASYWASLPLLYLSSLRTRWADARLAVYGVLVFTTLTTVATVLHLDRFHLAAPASAARVAAWSWLVVYAVVPAALFLLLVFQLRAPGGDPARVAAVPAWIRLALGIQALVMLLVGIGLFFAGMHALWPWPLTPLTGRAVGAWLIGVGVTAGQAWWENDLIRVRPMLVGSTLLAVLHLGVVARYGASIDWSRPHPALYAGFLLSLLGVGAMGWVAARQAGRVAAPRGPAA